MLFLLFVHIFSPLSGVLCILGFIVACCIFALGVVEDLVEKQIYLRSSIESYGFYDTHLVKAVLYSDCDV